MSTVKTNNVQIGQSATATQNFVWSVPVSPDGTVKLSRGNQGATTQDILSVDNSGNLKTNNVQIGQSGTATQNFVWEVPGTPDGTVKLARGNHGATTQDILSVDASGNVTAVAIVNAVDFNSTSDIALKDNILPISNPFDILNQLHGISFNWKSTGEQSYGLSAQEVEDVLPAVVKQRSDGYKGINYLNIIAFLIEAVKDLNTQLNDIKANK